MIFAFISQYFACQVHAESYSEPCVKIGFLGLLDLFKDLFSLKMYILFILGSIQCIKKKTMVTLFRTSFCVHPVQLLIPRFSFLVIYFCIGVTGAVKRGTEGLEILITMCDNQICGKLSTVY